MRRRPKLGLPVLLLITGLAVFVSTRSTAPTPRYTEASTWRALVGSGHPLVSTAGLRIVVLKTPSVAQRLAVAKYATEQQERVWTAQVYTAQQQVLVGLAASGFAVHPIYTFARVLDGFSATLDPRAEVLLEQNPNVAGVYSVRAAFPASISTGSLANATAVAPVALPGFDGNGVRIALLDTAVDRTQPYLGDRVESGIDIVAGAASADERHGTELAGLLVGARGPHGIHGAAPGASVVPIRVGRTYARSDQLIAGLDRAVDPNGDGDTHDAARVALVGMTEPYASFADAPEAQAVDGALALDTLVVVPAGNDGDAGPAYGSVDGPGGAAGALTIGATDPRTVTATVRLTISRGLRVSFDARLPLLGAVTPSHGVDLAIGLVRGDGEQATDYFDANGNDLVAGRAALVHAGADPEAAAASASQAGAAAVLFYGGNLPAGSLGLQSNVRVPVAAIPAAAARALLQRGPLVVALGSARAEPNPLTGRVASFSSRGLSFAGAIKPDLSAPGIGLATSDPGRSYVTVNGTSASAAAVAGAAAVLAQARPDLTAEELASLLVGSARPAGAALAAGGAGVVDVGAAVAEEISASSGTLEFDGKQSVRLTVRNVSAQRLVVTARPSPGLTVAPRTFTLAKGASKRIRVRTHALPGSAGVLELVPAGGESLRLPWMTLPRPPAGTLLPYAALDQTRFVASDKTPAVLTVDAGRVHTSGGVQIEPVSKLVVSLYTAAGVFSGVLARERDLLPGEYSFAVNGRGADGSVLPPGRYELRLVAWPPGGAAPSRRTVPFTLRSA